MGRTTWYDNLPGFIADGASIQQNNGRQIDWDRVPSSYRAGTNYTVTVNDADAAEGDTTLTVDALPVAIPAETVLDFGELAADEYTITLNDADAAEGDTTITVTALPVALPAGTVLDFGEHSVDTVQMLAKLTADAAASATSLTVEPLGHEIEDSSTADYPGVIQQQLVKVSAYAAASATSLTVEPLTGPVVDNATATYRLFSGTHKIIPAGTVMAELSSGKIIPRANVTASETATCLLLAAASSGDESTNVGYGVIVGGVVYQNLLPDYAVGEPWTTYKGELNTAGVGYFVWETYADDRGS